MALNQRTGFDGNRTSGSFTGLVVVDGTPRPVKSPSDFLSEGILDLLTLRQRCYDGDTDAYWTYGTKLTARELYVEAAEHYEAVASGAYDGHPLPAYDVCAAGEWTKADRHGRADLAFRRAVKAGVPFADSAHYDALVLREEHERATQLYPRIAEYMANNDVPTAVVTELRGC